MPISGFKKGDKVLTPAHNAATVTRAFRVGGREKVYVVYDLGTFPDRWFWASSLKLLPRKGNA